MYVILIVKYISDLINQYSTALKCIVKLIKCQKVIINNVYLLNGVFYVLGVYFAFYFKDRCLKTEPTLPPPIVSLVYGLV